MPSFFTNISETYKALAGTQERSHSKTFGAGSATSSTGKGVSKPEAAFRLVVTVLLLGIAVFLLTGDPKSQLASGMIGAVMGYWLK
ncbi:MAG TPA: hypothetical protein VIM55_04905 [Mucilaginibacter sp.]